MKPNSMKEKILLTATELIVKNGIKNTSLADIAKAVNISKGTLYYHYSSKDDLIEDIATMHLDAITTSVLNCVRGLDSDNSTEQMITLIMDKIAAIGGRGRIHMYILCEAITGNDSLKEKIKIRYIEWRETLDKELSAVGIKNSKAISFILVSIVDGLVVQGLLKGEEIPFEDVASFLVTSFFKC